MKIEFDQNFYIIFSVKFEDISSIVPFFPVKLDDNLLILHFIQVKFQDFLWILHYFSVKWRLWAHWGGRMILKSLRTAYFHFPHTLKAKCSLTETSSAQIKALSALRGTLKPICWNHSEPRISTSHALWRPNAAWLRPVMGKWRLWANCVEP